MEQEIPEDLLEAHKTVRLEVDWKNSVVDIFVKRDRCCPYPFLIASPKTQEIEEAHEGLGFSQFEELLRQMQNILRQIQNQELR